MTEPTPRLLTYEQAGKILQICVRSVFSLVKSKQLKAVRFGRTVRIDQGDLQAFIERAKTVPTKGGANCDDI